MALLLYGVRSIAATKISWNSLLRSTPWRRVCIDARSFSRNKSTNANQVNISPIHKSTHIRRNISNSKNATDGGASSAMEGDQFQYSIGPPDSGFSMFLAERTKKVHFIRHAEGFHNKAARESGSNECLFDMALWDARLTPEGIQQCRDLRHVLANRPSQGRSFTQFDLVVVSPLTRTLETAYHIFGPPRTPGAPFFLDSEIDPETGLPKPKFLVREECRERWGLYTCDGRRSVKELIKEFPGFDFSEVLHDEDIFYTPERESSEHTMKRSIQFLEWINQRPEKCIAVVTHSAFLRHLFMQFGADQGKQDKDRLQRHTGNCELRSVVLCSHGIKDATELRSMYPDATATTATANAATD